MVRFLLILFLFMASACMASEGDSIKPKRNLRGILSLDGKRSFIQQHSVGITGVRAGIKWKNNFRVGLGYYFLNREVKDAFPETDPLGNFNLRIHRLRFHYWGIFYEQLVFKNKHWEFYIPIVFGPGKATTRIFSFNEYQATHVRRVALLETGFGGEYRFLRYLGVGAGLGYRQILWADSNIKENLNAPIYSLRFKIYFDHLGEDLRWFYKRFYRED